MLSEVIFFVIFLVIYFAIYVDLKVNKENELYLFDKELTRYSLYKDTFLKLPFMFSGQHINEKHNKLTLEVRDKNDDFTKQEKKYEQIRLLEPYVRFKATQYVYTMKKSKHISFLTHETSVNYYIVKKGKVKISFIHPKFKDNMYRRDKLETTKEMIKYVKEHESIQTLECFENTVVFVPNHWILFIENDHSKSSIIESIQYETLINKVIGSIKNNLIKGNI